jgi:hypothetical protein
MNTFPARASTFAFLAMSLLLAACGGGDGSSSGGTGGTGGGGTGGGGGGTTALSHNAGANCMNCHTTGGAGAAKGIFTVAGTVFRNDGSAQPNATIKLYPDGSTTVQATLTTDSLGNFYTTQPVASLIPAPGTTFVQGADVVVSVTGGGSRTMPGIISNGSCNSCHSPGGGVGRVTAQQAGAALVTAASFSGSADALPPASSFRRLAHITVGDAHSCVLKNFGEVQCWGANGSGQLGNGSTSPASFSTVALNDVTALNAAGNTTCARVGYAPAASYYCWGAMPDGISAIPRFVNLLDTALLPQAVVQLLDAEPLVNDGGMVQNVPGLESSAFVHIARGTTHSCGITIDDRVKCWEGNSSSVDVPVE